MTHRVRWGSISRRGHLRRKLAGVVRAAPGALRRSVSAHVACGRVATALAGGGGAGAARPGGYHAGRDDGGGG